MDENNLDNSSELSYNEGNDKYEVIDMGSKKPLNDTECTHEQLIVDHEDTIGEAVYHGCANPECARGWYIQQ